MKIKIKNKNILILKNFEKIYKYVNNFIKYKKNYKIIFFPFILFLLFFS